MAFFGVANKEIEYHKSGNLQSLKRKVTNGTNERMIFWVIHEIIAKTCRIVVFQFPSVSLGVAVTWAEVV